LFSERGTFVQNIVVMATSDKNSSRIRFAAFSLILSGICFTLFPAVRPFFDESSPQAAVWFGSNRWVFAHSLGMSGFILFVLGLLGVYMSLRQTSADRGADWALVLSWIGAGLTLPFFGAEALALQVIGRAAISQNNPGLLPLVNSVRFGVGLLFIGSGLVLIALAAVVLAFAVWNSEILPRWSAVLIAIGFAVYAPLLRGAPGFQAMRIADGVLILVGCTWLAWGMVKCDQNRQLGPN